MENTIEILSGKLTAVEKDLSGLINSHNSTVNIYDNNFGKIGKWHNKQIRFNKCNVLILGCCIYMLYVHHKELKELKSKTEGQKKTEE